MAIKHVTNATKSPLLFIKLEDSGDNEVLEPGHSEEANVWTPHVDDQEQFSKKTIAIMDLRNGTLLGYLWEHKGILRTMTEMPGSFRADGKTLPGVSRGDINLMIDENGRLRGDSTSDSAKA